MARARRRLVEHDLLRRRTHFVLAVLFAIAAAVLALIGEPNGGVAFVIKHVVDLAR